MRNAIIKKRGYPGITAGSDLSLKIASYPISADWLARRLSGKGKSICELCCGVGISLIEFAKLFDNVVGVDNDKHVLRDCEYNISHAHLTNLTLIQSDIQSVNLLSSLKADIVAYDIPYWDNHSDDAATDKNPNLGEFITSIRRYVTDNIVIYTPPYLEHSYFTQLIGPCELVEVWINNSHDRNFVFLGNLVEQPDKTSTVMLYTD